MTDISTQARDILQRLGAGDPFVADGDLVCRSPIDGHEIGRLRSHTAAEATELVGNAHAAFQQWRTVPAPARGQFVRELGELLREHKDDLGALVSIEAGKIVSEGAGEVQEMIDICDLAVGLSRQLHGLTIATERPGHRMMEQWHPLGVIGVISAFNFPVAVWSWNAALAFVCGDAVVWKPSEKTTLTALGCQALALEAGRRAGVPDGLSAVLIGDRTVGEVLVDDPRVPLVSATGSTRMGKEVAPRVAARLGRTLLELGGNNAPVVAPSADLDLAVRGIVFSAVGTAGQRCTSLRRIIVHESIKDDLVTRLKAAYETLPIGSPLKSSTLVGPLVDETAFRAFGAAVSQAQSDGGRLATGGAQSAEASSSTGGGFYVHPAIIDMPAQTDIVKTETF
ncbi:aldehyde dehydrogenase family protein, partial [Aeromicrobium sp.]|uniref:aldehyde dehydrogenase family protein n=1 Tax=Aeromicrobium sp. TaxID=1871063 RepID=UPI0025BAED6B